MKLSKKLMIAACLTIAVPAAFAQQLTLSPATQTVSATAGATEATKFSFTLTTDTPVNITPSVNLPANVTFDSQTSCGGSLAAGQSCQYIYSYQPTTPTATPETLSLTVKTDTGVSSNTATATLNAVAPTLPTINFRSFYGDTGTGIITITTAGPQLTDRDQDGIQITNSNGYVDHSISTKEMCPATTPTNDTFLLVHVATSVWQGAYCASMSEQGCNRNLATKCQIAFKCASSGLMVNPANTSCALNKQYFVNPTDNRVYILN